MTRVSPIGSAATAVVVGLIALSVAFAQTGKPVPWKGFDRADIADRLKITTDNEGNLRWGPRTTPLPAMASPELRKAYMDRLKQSLSRPTTLDTDPAEYRRRMAEEYAKNQNSGNAVFLKAHPVKVEDTEVGGVRVNIFTPTEIAPRNRNRVVIEFEVPGEGIMLASLGKIRVMSMLFSARRPDGQPDGRPLLERAIALYRELLKTHKASQIAMFGLSGGCQLAGNTSVWMKQLNLPMPGALGLFTCAGGGKPGDTRITMDGLDPALSSFNRAGGPTIREPPKPGEPPSEILDADIPSGFPPSYILTGTRDMSLSHMVLLHRKLRRAGVVTDLNVFEGLWHGGNATLIPEAEEALRDFAGFLDRHMGV